MIRSLFGMLTALLLVAFAPAQNLEPYKQKLLGQPIVAQQIVGTSLANLYQNGGAVLVGFAEGEVLLTFINDQLPPDPVQVLTTSWTDAAGVTHTVSTPIIAQTPQGQARAREQHEAAVKWLQDKYPPKPV